MLVSNLSDNIIENGLANTSLLFEQLDATNRLTNSSMFVVDFAKKKMVYTTENLIFINEATPMDFQRECQIPYWALIVDKDLDIMLETRNAHFSLIEGFSIEDKLKYTYIIDYRIILRNREHVISQKFTPLKLTSDGKLWLGLFCITTSPHGKACKNIAIFGNGFRYTYNFEYKKFLPFNGYMELTLMEKAILLRASKGLATKQIAEDLGKSVNTVKTHKHRMFGKLNVKSMNEAITFVRNYNLY